MLNVVISISDCSGSLEPNKRGLERSPSSPECLEGLIPPKLQVKLVQTSMLWGETMKAAEVKPQIKLTAARRELL